MFEGVYFQYAASKLARCQIFYFLLSGHFYKILNLNFLCQYIIGSIPLLLLFNSCTILQIYKKNLTVGLYYLLNIHNFPLTQSKFYKS